MFCSHTDVSLPPSTSCPSQIKKNIYLKKVIELILWKLKNFSFSHKFLEVSRKNSMPKELVGDMHRNCRRVQIIYSQATFSFLNAQVLGAHVTTSVCSRVGIFSPRSSAPVCSELSHCEEGVTRWEE